MKYLIIALCVVFLGCKESPIDYNKAVPEIVCNKITGHYAIKVGDRYIQDTVYETSDYYHFALTYHAIISHSFFLNKVPYEKVFTNPNDAQLWITKWNDAIKREEIERQAHEKLIRLATQQDSLEKLNHLYQICKP